MTLYLENADTGRELRLWNGQEFERGLTVPETVYNPASTGNSQPVLSVLRQEGSITVDGIVLGQQRIDAGETNLSDPTAATAEWILELEAWVNGSPGTEAFQLRNDDTGDVTNAVPQTVNWSRGVGETASATYGVELVFGDGLGADLGITPDTPTIRATDTYDGLDLPFVFERSVDKTIELNSFEALLEADAEENDQYVEGSPIKRVTLLGEFDRTFSEQREFDREIRSRAGNGETYTFESAFPGDSFEAALVGYESSREAGVTQYGTYIVELVAGQAI
jgi:hypothetical protein